MFKSFIAWLDSYISREGPSSILKAMLGLLTFAGLLGTIFGNQAIRAAAFVVVILFTVSAILLLLADRQHLRRSYETERTLLTRYCDFLIESSTEPILSIEIWSQNVYIQPNGDAREVITLKAVAQREQVPFVRLTAGCLWNQPDKYRRDVKVTARSLTSTGTPGPRWNVTTTWISTQKMVSIIHLHEPARHGEELLFEVTRNWPAKCLPLIREGIPEDFVIQTTNFLAIQEVDYRVVLPSGFDAVHELIGSTMPNVRLSAEQYQDQEGRRVFVWRTGQVPARTKVGMRLELT